MAARPRLVIDTNVLVSFALLPGTTTRRAVELALRRDLLIVSDATLAELRQVLFRSKFDRYVSRGEREAFLTLVERIAFHADIVERIRACLDSSDDKFLEAAVNGGAERLMTGDTALLALSPFRGVDIVTPAAYLASPP